MSALTDLFTSMANKIRSKTGTATTYTPPQMVSDGIDDVFDAGVASATTPITPSDSSPVAMSANTGYKPTTNGYAIANNPTSITPSNSSPVTISSGTIYKASGNGKAVESVQTITPTYGVEDTVQSGAIIRFGDSGVITKEIPTPLDLTPSNSSPATITSGGLYSATANGKAVESVTAITPSNSSPVSLSSDGIYKPSSSGYAISSYVNRTPSDTSTVGISSGQIVRSTAAGYLVKTVSNLGGTPDKTYQNNAAGSSGSVDITVTKKPRYIIFGAWSRTGSSYYGMVGIIDVAKSKAYRMGIFSQGTFSEDWENYTSYFPTISSTKVTYSYAGYGGNHRAQIMIYY